MKRYPDDLVATDLNRKMVLVTGPRQVGKTTLCRHIMERFQPSQYLNWDVGPDRAADPSDRMQAFGQQCSSRPGRFRQQVPRSRSHSIGPRFASGGMPGFGAHHRRRRLAGRTGSVSGS
ncbi:MAG: AAA family ATPase [Planctomyces sp.]|nr:AAA family ATPase [Planctomyces sp.]